tara:strand:- start:278 stop:604 length:327 start_codon:yes stop_codon:yes gene_type:complete
MGWRTDPSKPASSSMVPDVKSKYMFPYAETPASGSSGSYENRGTRPSSIYVKDNHSADVYLTLNASSSWVNFGQMPVGFYDLHPVAWSGSATDDYADGDIIFIYKGEH